MGDTDIWATQRQLLGSYIRTQRQLAKLSLRDLAERTSVSNPYLSQIERGIHEPSLRVLKAIAEALDLSADTLLSHAGLMDDGTKPPDADSQSSAAAAIKGDPSLTEAQKTALLAVYQSYREANGYQ